MAGVLIGLGGPFWFRVFTSLSRAFHALKALGPGGRKPAKSEPPPEKTAEDSAKPKNLLDALKVTVALNMAASPIPRGRDLLNPNGELL